MYQASIWNLTKIWGVIGTDKVPIDRFLLCLVDKEISDLDQPLLQEMRQDFTKIWVVKEELIHYYPPHLPMVTWKIFNTLTSSLWWTTSWCPIEMQSNLAQPRNRILAREGERGLNQQPEINCNHLKICIQLLILHTKKQNKILIKRIMSQNQWKTLTKKDYTKIRLIWRNKWMKWLNKINNLKHKFKYRMLQSKKENKNSNKLCHKSSKGSRSQMKVIFWKNFNKEK